jgi:hypothetical protein
MDHTSCCNMQGILAAAGILLKSVCTALDTAAGTSFVSEHAELFQSIPRATDVEPPFASHPGLQVVLRPDTWRAVQAQLLPQVW